jgi:hypothetical protein
MNRAAPEFVPSVTTNPDPPLKTRPVGPPATLTTSGVGGKNGVPVASYSVDVSV